MAGPRNTKGQFVNTGIRERRAARKAGNVKSGAKGGIKIEGQDFIMRRLQAVAKETEANLRPAITEVVAMLQRESMKRTPIDTGNLRGSHRSRVIGNGKKTIGAVYLTAAYALFVHEALSSVNFKSKWPRGRKFLERAFVDNISDIANMIGKHITR